MCADTAGKKGLQAGQKIKVTVLIDRSLSSNGVVALREIRKKIS